MSAVQGRKTGRAYVVFDVGLATQRNDNPLHPCAMCRKELLAQASDWKNLAGESDFARHRCERERKCEQREENGLDLLKSPSSTKKRGWRVRLTWNKLERTQIGRDTRLGEQRHERRENRCSCGGTFFPDRSFRHVEMNSALFE